MSERGAFPQTRDLTDFELELISGGQHQGATS